MKPMTQGLMAALLLAAAAPVFAAIEASDGWSRETIKGVDVAVGYLTLRNTSSERRELIKITAPQAASIGLHRSSVDANGVSHMWPVGKLELLPGEVMKLSPNGVHLMLNGLKQPLTKGMQVPVTVVFEHEKPVTVQLQVRALADGYAPAGGTATKPDAAAPMHHDHGAHAGH
jgi:copper(I)-binding protein